MGRNKAKKGPGQRKPLPTLPKKTPHQATDPAAAAAAAAKVSTLGSAGPGAAKSPDEGGEELTRSEELRALPTLSGLRTTPGMRVNQINLTFYPSRSAWAKAGYFNEVATPMESNACADALQLVIMKQVEDALKVPIDVVFPDGRIALIKIVDNRTRKAPGSYRLRVAIEYAAAVYKLFMTAGCVSGVPDEELNLTMACSSDWHPASVAEQIFDQFGGAALRTWRERDGNETSYRIHIVDPQLRTKAMNIGVQLTTGKFFKFTPLLIPFSRETVWMYGHTGIGSARMLSLPHVANLIDVSDDMVLYTKVSAGVFSPNNNFVNTVSYPFTRDNYNKCAAMLAIGNFSVYNIDLPDADPLEIFVAPTLRELEHAVGIRLCASIEEAGSLGITEVPTVAVSLVPVITGKGTPHARLVCSYLSPSAWKLYGQAAREAAAAATALLGFSTLTTSFFYSYPTRFLRGSVVAQPSEAFDYVFTRSRGCLGSFGVDLVRLLLVGGLEVPSGGASDSEFGGHGWYWYCDAAPELAFVFEDGSVGLWWNSRRRIFRSLGRAWGGNVRRSRERFRCPFGVRQLVGGRSRILTCFDGPLIASRFDVLSFGAGFTFRDFLPAFSHECGTGTTFLRELLQKCRRELQGRLLLLQERTEGNCSTVAAPFCCARHDGTILTLGVTSAARRCSLYSDVVCCALLLPAPTEHARTCLAAFCTAVGNNAAVLYLLRPAAEKDSGGHCSAFAGRRPCCCLELVFFGVSATNHRRDSPPPGVFAIRWACRRCRVCTRGYLQWCRPSCSR